MVLNGGKKISEACVRILILFRFGARKKLFFSVVLVEQLHSVSYTKPGVPVPELFQVISFSDKVAHTLKSYSSVKHCKICFNNQLTHKLSCPDPCASFNI